MAVAKKITRGSESAMPALNYERVLASSNRSKPVMILGRSGGGKSKAIENLNPASTFLINVIGKDLPFRGWRRKYTEGKNMLISDNYDTITKQLISLKSARGITDIVIDDFQYLMADEFMRRSYEKGYEKFTEIGRHAWDLLWLVSGLGSGKIVYVLAHTERTEDGDEKCKTIGKLLDEKIGIEGMFTIVLACVVDKGSHFFSTVNNGKNVVKAPVGMFKDALIPNDLRLVSQCIRAYD